MTALLEVASLTLRFGGVTALDQLDLALPAGARRCLIGPNGAGKSTFLKCLTGQLRASSGSIHFAGADISRWQTSAIANAGIGLKTQVPSLFEALTVPDHYSLADPRGDARAWLDEINLAERAHWPVSRLSHGERQMVELATVLAARPRLVLLDEPAAGLTDDEADRIAALIRRLDGHTAVIVVEHDMHFVESLDCPITVLHRGRTLAEGSYADVMADPAVAAAYFGHSRKCSA